MLDELAGLVTPDTILRWYRELIARKYDDAARRDILAEDRQIRTGIRPVRAPQPARPPAPQPCGVAHEAEALTSLDDEVILVVGKRQQREPDRTD